MMLSDIFQNQKEYSAHWFDHLPELKGKLVKLRDTLIRFEQKIYDALWTDLNKSPTESYLTEYQLALDEVNWFIKHLEKIYHQHSVHDPLWFIGHRSTVVREPYGVAIIYAPYNYPFNLSMVPLIGAIACSNTVILKPSKITPAINQVMKEIVTECFSPEQCYVLSQAENENPALYEELYAYDFDLVFFTGSEAIGREIYKVYSEKLIPVILELGGKSPAIVHPSADLKIAAKRIIWGKTMNNGQTCVAPDYVLVHESQFDDLVAGFKQELKVQFPGHTNKTVARMSSPRAEAKIRKLLEGARIIYEYEFNQSQHFWLADGEDLNAPLMNNEIFGPVLPIVRYKTIEDLLAIIRHHPDPLAMYLFAHDKTFINQMVQMTKSGAIVVNDLLIHLTKHTPFGGIKHSGVGHYHKMDSVQVMMHVKPVIYSSKLDINARYQPYNEQKLSIVKRFLK